MTTRTLLTMREIRAAHPVWFSPSARRFFSSRIHPRVYGAGYFVTSEAGPDGVRCYTVRHATADRIETVGEFMQYATRGAAHAAARRVAS